MSSSSDGEKKLIYRAIPDITDKEHARELLANTNGDDLIRALLGICCIEDWEWVQNIYLRYIHHEEFGVAAAAVTGLGHLARIAGSIDKDEVIGALEKLRAEKPEFSGKVEDAISDIEIFVK